MTIIVGLVDNNSVHLGCDSQASSGWNKNNREDSKIFIAHGIGYGFTGSYRMGQILRYHTKEVLSSMRSTDVYGYVVTSLVPMYREILQTHGYKKTNNGVESGGTFLLAIDGNLFTIFNDFQVASSCEDYSAVGCGEQYALGAMYSNSNIIIPESRVDNAISAAKKYSNGCGGETRC